MAVQILTDLFNQVIRQDFYINSSFLTPHSSLFYSPL